MRISFYTLGCKLNQAETAELREKFRAQGFCVVPAGQLADFYLVNACAVTRKAEKETRQFIHKIRRMAPQSYLVVTGCVTNFLLADPKIRSCVSQWISNDKKSILDKLIPLPAPLKKGELEKSKRNNFFSERKRALIKIQEGCQNYCTYCIVPYLRRKIISQPVKEIIQAIRDKEKLGYNEIVLVGTNIDQYQYKYNKFGAETVNLAGLIKEILGQTNIARIRLSSLWPTAIDSDLLGIIKNNPRVCSHIHLSVQSACDKILKRMKRDYTRQDLLRIIKRLEKIPALNLTADIIVGFPGEEESDFQETYNFVKQACFLKIHVFRFSPRPGTPAVQYKGQISEKIKKERSKKMIDLGKRLSQKQREKFIGQSAKVLVEGKKDEFWRGFTTNYLKIFIKNNKNLTNQMVDVKLTQLCQDGMEGEL